MMVQIDEDRYKEITGNAETLALRGIWSQLGGDTTVFSCQRELFLWILERLLREQRIKLHKRGVFLTGSVEEQVEAFRRTLPTSEEDADRQCTLPGREPAYPEFGMNVWWPDSCATFDSLRPVLERRFRDWKDGSSQVQLNTCKLT